MNFEHKYGSGKVSAEQIRGYLRATLPEGRSRVDPAKIEEEINYFIDYLTRNHLIPQEDDNEGGID